MGTTRSVIARRAALALTMVAVLVLMPLSGCDTIDPGRENVVTEVPLEFRFELTRAQLQAAATVAADDRLDVAGHLATLGFSPGDILGAEVTRVTLRNVQPVGASLNSYLSSVSVRTSVGSLPEVVLASSTTMSAAGNQELNVANVANFGSYVRTGSAPVRIAVQPGQSLTAENYVLRVEVRIRLTLEGV